MLNYLSLIRISKTIKVMNSMQDINRLCFKICINLPCEGLNLRNYFTSLDIKNDYLVSETEYISVLRGQLKETIQLEENEMLQLCNFFRVKNGKICYSQFCDVIDEAKNIAKHKLSNISHSCSDVNILSTEEYDELQQIMTQIANFCMNHKISFWKSFQDYELTTKSGGTVTVAHFRRILKSHGIALECDAYRLFAKKFVQNYCFMNYIAFLDDISDVQKSSNKKNNECQIAIDPLPEYSPPEIGQADDQKFVKTSYSSILKSSGKPMPLMEIILRIQRYVLEHRIRVSEFFKDFDTFNNGRIPISFFKRGLSALRISNLGTFNLSPMEIDSLVDVYKDPNDTELICWRTFEDDIDHVFTVKELEKHPEVKIICPPKNVVELDRKGRIDWDCVDENTKQTYIRTMRKIRQKLTTRSLDMKEYFRNHDRNKNGHVSRYQLRQVIRASDVLTTVEEHEALEKKYSDDKGFDYVWFMKEIEGKVHEKPLCEKFSELRSKINTKEIEQPSHENETNIDLILSKIKTKVARERIKASEFLRPYDWCNHFVIKKADFVRGLDQLRCNLSRTEINTLVKYFEAPGRTEFIEYVRFEKEIEGNIKFGGLELESLTKSRKPIKSEAATLNCGDGNSMSSIMTKLLQFVNPNLWELFKSYDKHNLGFVSKNHFGRALAVRGMLDCITGKEFNILYEYFSSEKSGSLQFDYRKFLKSLDECKNDKRDSTTD